MARITSAIGTAVMINAGIAPSARPMPAPTTPDRAAAGGSQVDQRLPAAQFPPPQHSEVCAEEERAPPGLFQAPVTPA